MQQTLCGGLAAPGSRVTGGAEVAAARVVQVRPLTRALADMGGLALLLPLLLPPPAEGAEQQPPATPTLPASCSEEAKAEQAEAEASEAEQAQPTSSAAEEVERTVSGAEEAEAALSEAEQAEASPTAAAAVEARASAQPCAPLLQAEEAALSSRSASPHCAASSPSAAAPSPLDVMLLQPPSGAGLSAASYLQVRVGLV